jgi:nicotinamidase-related amidase
MTTLGDRPHTALLVIDVQNGVVAGAHDRDGVVGTINALVHKARAEQVPVVWVQHSDEDLEQGSDDWQIVDELSPADDEPVVQKHYGDSFEDTELESILAARRIGRVVVSGAQSDACVRSTLHGALVRGYDVTLVGDAHTTEDLTEYGAPSPDLVISHTNLYWQWAKAPGRRGDVVTSTEVRFSDAGA